MVVYMHGRGPLWFEYSKDQKCCPQRWGILFAVSAKGGSTVFKYSIHMYMYLHENIHSWYGMDVRQSRSYCRQHATQETHGT